MLLGGNMSKIELAIKFGSNEIIVFPCANRGAVSNAAYSQLLTEYNLTHTNGIIGNFDSYVINESGNFNDEVQFKAVIGGYLFIIPNGFDTTSYNYIGIMVPADLHHPFENIIGFHQIFQMIKDEQ